MFPTDELFLHFMPILFVENNIVSSPHVFRLKPNLSDPIYKNILSYLVYLIKILKKLHQLLLMFRTRLEEV